MKRTRSKIVALSIVLASSPASVGKEAPSTTASTDLAFCEGVTRVAEDFPDFKSLKGPPLRVNGALVHSDGWALFSSRILLSGASFCKVSVSDAGVRSFDCGWEFDKTTCQQESANLRSQLKACLGGWVASDQTQLPPRVLWAFAAAKDNKLFVLSAQRQDTCRVTLMAFRRMSA